MTIAYASGRHAWGTCQKCGLRFAYHELVNDGYYQDLRVCAGCYDDKHPQDRPIRAVDPVALWRPSPDTIHAPSAPVLSVDGALFSWTAAESQDGLIAGYRLYQLDDDGETWALFATIEIARDFDTTALTALEYLASLDSGSYSFRMIAYDTRGLSSVPSNVVSTTIAAGVALTVTVGNQGSAYGYDNFSGPLDGSSPDFGSISPQQPLVGSAQILTLESITTGFELFIGTTLLDAQYTTLRVQTASGTVDLDLSSPDDGYATPTESYWFWSQTGIWSAADIGQQRTVTFL